MKLFKNPPKTLIDEKKYSPPRRGGGRGGVFLPFSRGLWTSQVYPTPIPSPYGEGNNKLGAALIFLLMFTVTGYLHAVPNQIRFQGRLTDKQGVPIIGTPQVTFDLFSAPSGGSSLWNSGQLTVTTNDAGLFATDLGPIPVSIFSQNPKLYLQVTVAGTAGPQILLPRQQLSSVPYALETDHAIFADSAASVVDNAITSVKIQDGAIQNVDLSTDSVDSLNIKDGGVGFIDLAVNSVRTANIQDGSIQWVDLSTGAVRTENIVDGSVEGVDIATDAITTAHILDGTIQNNDMADGIVDTVKLADASVTTVKIATGAVTRDRIQDLAVDSSKIENVDVSKLAGQINGAQIQNGAITQNKVDAVSFQSPGVGLVPQGAIFMFLAACPLGYSEVTALRGNYPVGADVADTNPLIPGVPNNVIVGSLKHNHAVSVGIDYGPEIEAFDAGSIWVYFSAPVAATAVLGSPVSGVGVRGKSILPSAASAFIEPMPPSLTVTFCKKD